MAPNSQTTGNDRGLISVGIVRFSAIGDVAMAVPVVYAACRAYPDVRFVMVTRRTMADIFVNPPSNLSVVGVDLKTDYTGPAGMMRLARELKADYSLDLIVDLHDVLRTKMLRTFLRLKGVKAKVIIKDRANKRALTRRWHKKLVPLVSQRARYRAAFHKAGMPVSDSFDGLFGGHGKCAAKLFERITPPKRAGEKWLGVAPFAAHQGKIYPIELMQQVLDRVAAERPDVKMFFFGGGKHEQEVLEQWERHYPGAVSLAGKRYGFATELALMNHLDAMLTMDSSNMHLAAIASAPTVSIWGATHPYCGFKGWHQADADIVQLPMTCRPCSVFGNKPCRRADYMCLNGIKPQQVAQKVISRL